MSDIPLGLCQCGCGQPTNIATKTREIYGHIKGKPLRFLHGHRVRLDRKTWDQQVTLFWASIEIQPNGCWL